MIEIESLISIFFLVFTAELGDKTQLVALSLTGSSSSPWPVFFGSSLALTTSTAIAVFAGKTATETIPRIAPPLSATLFYFFGLWLLLKKEPPPIKQAFINATLLEQQEAGILKKILKNDPDGLQTIREIQEHELHHARFFRRIIKEKKLFRDDINRESGLAELTERLVLPGKLRKQPIPVILETLRQAEQSCIDFYSFLLAHLEEDHHSDEDETRELLHHMIKEEQQHERILAKLTGKETDIQPRAHSAEKNGRLKLVFSAFLMVFFAELGDKTQLTAFSAAAAAPSPLSIFIGASLALVASSLLSVTLGKWLSSRIKERTLATASGILFLAAGSYVIVNYLR